MEDIKKAQQRLVNAIVAMHPQLCMGDEKQEELYLAMHDLTSKMAKLNECGGECSNENSVLHLQRVSNRRELLIDFVKDGCTPEYWKENKEHEIEQIDIYLKSINCC